MKVVKKDEKGNTQDTLEKKEKRKSKTAKVPVMTQAPKGKLEAMATPGKEKVMALKDHILDELMQPNLQHEEINVGSRVKKKDAKEYDASKVQMSNSRASNSSSANSVSSRAQSQRSNN
jgi:hypothetical protein